MMKSCKVMTMALMLGLVVTLLPRASWAGNVSIGVVFGLPFPVVAIAPPPPPIIFPGPAFAVAPVPVHPPRHAYGYYQHYPRTVHKHYYGAYRHHDPRGHWYRDDRRGPYKGRDDRKRR